MQSGRLGHSRQLRFGDLDGLIDRGCREGRFLGNEFGLRLGAAGRGCLSALATEHLLHLASVVASVLLGQRANVLGLLLNDTLNLCGLSVDDIRSALEMLVDKLLVGGVDQGHEESDSGADHSKTPVRDELDEEE